MILASILLLLAAVHVYWACGGKWASDAVIPRSESGARIMNPGTAATLTVVGLLLTAAWIAFGAGIPPDLRVWLLRAMAAVFTLRAIGDFRYAGFFKRHTSTVFAWWDTRLYSPLCVAMAVLALFGR